MTKVEKFVSLLSKKTPGVKLKFKTESFFMKLLGLLLFFNPGFMKNYVTTIGKTIYLPSKESLNKHSMLEVLAHEYYHIRDNQTFSILYKFLYLFPITLLPLAAVLFFFLPWYLALAACVVCLLPWPAPGRKYFETRGYTMSMFANNLLMKKDGVSLEKRRQFLLEQLEFYNKQFTSSAYYFMWPFGVKTTLKRNLELILNEKLQSSEVFADVEAALKETI